MANLVPKKESRFDATAGHYSERRDSPLSHEMKPIAADVALQPQRSLVCPGWGWGLPFLHKSPFFNVSFQFHYNYRYATLLSNYYTHCVVTFWDLTGKYSRLNNCPQYNALITLVKQKSSGDLNMYYINILNRQ